MDNRVATATNLQLVYLPHESLVRKSVPFLFLTKKTYYDIVPKFINLENFKILILFVHYSTLIYVMNLDMYI